MDEHNFNCMSNIGLEVMYCTVFKSGSKDIVRECTAVEGQYPFGLQKSSKFCIYSSIYAASTDMGNIQEYVLDNKYNAPSITIYKGTYDIAYLQERKGYS